MEKFHSFSITHKGAKHKNDVPCQDASAHLEHETAAIAIVADGHGSSRCFRSDIGAVKAVEITKICIDNFIKEIAEAQSDMIIQLVNPQEDDLSKIKTALSNVARKIINKWFVAVLKDDEVSPLTNDPRLEGIDPKYKDRYINDVDYRCHAYGTTLMLVVMCKYYWFGFHVGDGKCIVLYEDGSWKMPLPWDDRCTFNTTTSICDDDSLSGFRYWFGSKNDKGGYTEYGYGVEGQNKDYVTETASRPLAIFIGSDGVEDSYPRVDNDKYVINFYRNRIISIAENDLDTFNAEIVGLAKRFADRESTDDVSIAGIVGDFTGKTEMIDKMKMDSAHHETSELAAEKRRDADEKKDAFEAVGNRTQTVISNLRQLEGKITTIEQEISSLDSKRKTLEVSLLKSNADVGTSDRAMVVCQERVQKFESERDRYIQEQHVLEEKITIADDEVRKAKKSFDKVSRDCSTMLSSLRRANDSYNKHLQKLSTPELTQTVAEQVLDTVFTQTNRAFEAFFSVDVQNPISPVNNDNNTVPKFSEAVTDTKLERLKQDVERKNAGHQNLQTQAVVARQNIEAKRRELEQLRLKLSSTKQCIREVGSELVFARQDYCTVETQSRQQRISAKQCQNEILEIERRMKLKQADVGKLKGELGVLREQTKKQTDTLNIIREAWEKAEADAKALESSNQISIYGGGDGNI